MPIDQRYFQLLGLRIGYRQGDSPAGDPILVIHGWAASSRIWLATIERLRSRFHCLALDLPGHGLSENLPIEWHTVENYVELCRQFGDELALTRPVLMGHSMGGLLALEVAVRDRGLLRELVLVCPAGSRRVNSPGSLPAWLQSHVLGLTRSLRPLSEQPVSTAPTSWFPGARDVAERAKRGFRDLTPESALSSMSSLLGYSMRDRVAQLGVPMLMFGGQRDRLVPADKLKSLAGEMPNTRAVTLELADHPFHESPRSFFRETEAFVDPLEVS